MKNFSRVNKVGVGLKKKIEALSRKQISEALRRFGISETSNYVLVGRFDATAEEVTSNFSRD